jgi:hypothetical protein
MITSIFSKSKPINILIVAFLVSLIFVYIKYDYFLMHSSFYEIVQQVILLLMAIFMIFVLDFIISKNDLTKKNSYTILLFGLFIMLIPISISQSNMLLANLFILFALRRLVSLHSKIDIKKKLADAAFWIGIASLFYFWAILFFILIIVALLYYSQNDIKNWIIPFVALLVIVLITVSYNIVIHDSFLSSDLVLPTISFDFSVFNNIQNIISITLIMTLLIWTFIYYIKSTRERISKIKPSYIIIGFWVIIALVIILISPLKNGSEFIFLFAPLAIIMTNYLELLKDNWFKETLLIVLFLTPLMLLVL